MRNRRWFQRGIALAVIASASAIAFAALPGGLTPVPPVIVISTMPGFGGTTTGALRNDNTTSVMVSSIDPDGSCAASGIVATGAPFTVAPLGGMETFSATCPASGTSGIRRCVQHVMNGPMQVANVTILCMTSTGSGLQWAGGTSLDLGEVIVNMTGSADMLMIVNQSGTTFNNVSLQLADQDNNFEIESPCFGAGCDMALTVDPGGVFDLPVRCTPKSVGMLMTTLYVVADNGASLPPVTLTCRGLAGSGMDPAITVDQSSVTLMHPVNSGSASSTVRITNTGVSGLEISVLQVTGADWASVVAPPCDSLPCMIGSTEHVDVSVVFSPTVLGARNGSLLITSNDPGTPTLDIPLYGTGQGGVLAPDGLGTPPMIDLGSVPIGVTTSTPFTLRNDGDLPLDPVDLSVSGVFSIDTPQVTIAASSTHMFMASCTPTAEQEFTSEIVVTSSDAVIGSPLSIMVRCQGTTGSFYAAPVRFDEVRVNTGQTRRTVTVISVGPTLDIASEPTLATPIAGMSIPPVPPMTFAPGSPATFEVEIDPTVDVDLANIITVATTTDGSIEIPVTGKVVTPDVDVPAEIMAGSFCIGQATMPTTTRLDANGTASIALPARPMMAGGASSPFQLSYTSPVMYPYRLPAGARAMVEITPLRQMMPGVRTDDLVWATDSPGETAPQTTVIASFIGDGGAVAPQAIDFGGWPLRTPADSRSIRIQNCGTEPMALLGASITPPDEFRDDSPEPLPEVLQPDQIATFTVGFTPRRVGSRMGTVTIDSSKGPLIVTLFGTGLGDSGTNGEATSFYACDCATSDPSGAWPAVLVVIVLRRRRRR